MDSKKASFQLDFAGGNFSLSINEGGRLGHVSREIFHQGSAPSSGEIQAPHCTGATASPWGDGQGLSIQPLLPRTPNLDKGPFLTLCRAPSPWESFQVTREVKQHHVVRLVCGGEDAAAGASADTTGMAEPWRTSFSPGGAAPARGQWGDNGGWGTWAPQPGDRQGTQRSCGPPVPP